MYSVNLRIAKRLLLLLTLFFAAHPVDAQTDAASLAASPRPAAVSFEPGPKPHDAPAGWKRFVGIYEYSNNGRDKHSVVILERNQRAYMHSASGPDEEIHFLSNPTRMIVPDPVKGSWSYEISEQPGTAPAFVYLMASFVRNDAGCDPSHFYHITPVRPIDQLRAEALAAKPPLATHPFRRPDLVELVTLDSSIHLDIRYAQSNNFLSTPVYTQARASMQRPAAEALIRVSQKLQPLGYGLLIHDAYRPWYITKMFWDATPPQGKQFVADPKQGSKHNRGCAVDLTLYDLATGHSIEMPGLYDEMSPRSFPNFPGGTSLQRWHRDLLRRAMESEGFTVNESEWWHFDYKDWKYYQIMNEAFEALGAAVPASSSVR
jgi:D-alanyl-D-alanine dipeptidase